MLNGPFLPPKSGSARQMVIFLHGYGADGNDLISIGEEWRDALPDAVFLSPHAPERCEMSPFGYQWFSIRAIDKRTFEREKQAERAAGPLNAYIDAKLAEWGVDESALVVAGFSQGAMMAMYTMPRRAGACAGVIGYSGMLVNAEGLKDEEIVKPPVLIIHGDADDVVPPFYLKDAEEGLTAAGFRVEAHLRPGLGHGIDAFGLRHGLEFARQALCL